MKISHAELAQKLGAGLGAEAIEAETETRARHIIDGAIPAIVCTPKNTEQIATALRICAQAEAAVIPWGGGTALAIGNLPRQADIVIKTTALNRVIEHDHANLTVTAQSGIVLAELQERLAPQKQFAPFDPPFPERATIGGVVAANVNGPRRSRYGSVRDLIIGMKVVLGSGEAVKAGGKVVKNVAGYDMCKLFTGSLGTLGILTEVTLRVAPIAERSATAVACGSLERATELIKDLTASKLLPSATFLARGVDEPEWKLSIRFEGFEATVARQLKDWDLMAHRAGMKAEIDLSENETTVWRTLQDFPLRPESVCYRLTVPRGRAIAVIRAVQGVRENGNARAIVADVTIGTLWIAEQPSLDCAKNFAGLIALARQHLGHAVIFAAPSKLKTSIDVWGPAPPSLALMTKIKQQFDPKGILNPGRFVGGI